LKLDVGDVGLHLLPLARHRHRAAAPLKLQDVGEPVEDLLRVTAAIERRPR